MASVKTEPIIKADPSIKTDPDAINSMPGVMSDDDIYEDAGDLEFAHLDRATNPAAADVYLTHVPGYLHQAWAHLDDDEEIRIGTVRKWIEVGKDGRQTVCHSPSLLHSRICIQSDYGYRKEWHCYWIIPSHIINRFRKNTL
jgi:hypothetical protein